MHRFFPRMLAVALALVIASGCSKVGAGGADSRHAYTRPHELRYAAAEDITGLNPLLATQAVVSYMSSMTMAYLVKTDERGYPTVPELATVIPSKANGGISPDGKTITWHLRKGVVWSDGKPFTADDVVFSTNAVNDPKVNVASRDGWELITKIDEPDKYTVVYHLKTPYAPFAVTFFSTAGANPAIMPAHLLAGKNLNTDPYNSLPIGIGPFKYQQWKRGDSVVMVPNPTYFRGAPKLQKITYETIQDRNTVLQLLRTHEIDLWIEVAPHFINDVRAISGLAISMEPSYVYDHLDFNLRRPVFADRAVRDAMRMATDRATLNKKIRFGLFDLGESVVPPVSNFHKNIPLVPFNIAGANALLDKAGWKRGPDGVRSKNGIRLSVELASSSGSPDSDLEIELLRSWWKQIGIELQVKRYLSSLLFAPAQTGGIIYGGKFDMVVFAWGGDPQQDLANEYACNRIVPNGQNDLFYCDTKVSDVIAQGKTEYDPAKRVAGMNYLQQKIFEDDPTIVLDSRKLISAYNDDLKNWHPSTNTPMDNMLGVDI
jgi:peptide/nickel transport system substrate-binding protein